MARRTRKRILASGIVAAALAAGGVVLVWGCAQPSESTYYVPPIVTGTAIMDPMARTKGLVSLQAWPGLPRRGVVVTLWNWSGKDVTMDLRPFCGLTGLKAYATEADGTRHELGISQCVSFPHHLPPGLTKPPVFDGLEMLTLKPEEAFSWPVYVQHPDDRPSRERLPLGYTIDHFEVELSLADGTMMTSNGFDLPWRDQDRRTRGKCPDDEFAQRLNTTYIYGARRDVGLRLAALLWHIEMRSNGLLTTEQFKKLTDLTVEDPSPLVRAYGAMFPELWPVLILDADPTVRRAILEACAQDHRPPGGEGVYPVLVTLLLTGDAETRVLALKGLRNGGGQHRQFADAIRQAKNDPDPQVAATAKELFQHIE